MQASGRGAVAIQADAASPEAYRNAVKRAVDKLGGLDILVNNVGVLLPGSFPAQAIEEIDLQLDVNIRSVFVVTQAALKHVTIGGRIISVGSNAGLSVPFAGIAVYAASKSALESFIRGLARELGPREITVNLVRPCPIDTDMNPADGAPRPFRTSEPRHSAIRQCSEGHGGRSLPRRTERDFQSVYLFAIAELFKDRTCITLLDEPAGYCADQMLDGLRDCQCLILDTGHLPYLDDPGAFSMGVSDFFRRYIMRNNEVQRQVVLR